MGAFVVLSVRTLPCPCKVALPMMCVGAFTHEISNQA